MNEIIEEKLKKYAPKDSNEVSNALKEITQELILFALAQTNFFSKAYFCGGTGLRIVYGLERFSEDLDFSTRTQMTDFNFDDYMDEVLKILLTFGIEMEVSKKKDDTFVKKRELKENSIKRKLSFPSNGKLKKIIIKLEIDSTPPAEARFEDKFLDFPQLYKISMPTKDTLFAGKLHALICRPYVKGRDWYDFLWYVKEGYPINSTFLASALNQMGPFKGTNPIVTQNFLVAELGKKIKANDWEVVRSDVERFLRPHELPTLKLWGQELFLDRLEKLKV
jgi:predicted nucleotidyltransferase component of viral defense system